MCVKQTKIGGYDWQFGLCGTNDCYKIKLGHTWIFFRIIRYNQCESVG